jgi:UDP-N-acetylglucosamine enolpyruvyl transferase
MQGARGPTVTGIVNLIIAVFLANDIMIIQHVPKKPEIEDLSPFLL